MSTCTERKEEKEEERVDDLVLVDVEAAELIMLNPAGDRERVRHESPQHCPHHFLTDALMQKKPRFLLRGAGRRRRRIFRSEAEKELARSVI